MPLNMMRRIAIIGLFITSGCASELSVLTEQTRNITPIDFAVEEIDASFEVDLLEGALEQEAEVIDSETVLIEEALAEREEFDESMTPDLVGIPLTIEALVGQVNGRPIYANKVLDPVADQIEAASKKLSRTEFADEIRSALYAEHERMGTSIRGGRMYELVITDLLLSEAVSGMSKEQSYGLLAIVGQMRSDLTSSQGGSETRMKDIIEQQSGITLDKFLELQRDQILIDALYRQKIWPKVNVTWRDIQREFEQVTLGDELLFVEEDEERTQNVLLGLKQGIPLGNIQSARGTVTLGMIRFKQDDAVVKEIRSAFAEGISFSEVAVKFDIADGGKWETFQMGLGGIEDIEVGPVIKSRLKGIGVNDYVAPFELGTSIVWISVLEVKQPISLYNRRVQIALQNALRWIQFNREKERYVESLWGEGSLDEVKSMADRVTNIAVRRYQQ
jgi:hypothetical protein